MKFKTTELYTVYYYKDTEPDDEGNINNNFFFIVIEKADDLISYIGIWMDSNFIKNEVLEGPVNMNPDFWDMNDMYVKAKKASLKQNRLFIKYLLCGDKLHSEV